MTQTLKPFCRLLILSISSSTRTSLYSPVAEKLGIAKNGFVAGNDTKLCTDYFEVEGMAGSKFGALNLFQNIKGDDVWTTVGMLGG